MKNFLILIKIPIKHNDKKSTTFVTTEIFWSTAISFILVYVMKDTRETGATLLHETQY